MVKLSHVNLNRAIYTVDSLGILYLYIEKFQEKALAFANAPIIYYNPPAANQKALC